MQLDNVAKSCLIFPPMFSCTKIQNCNICQKAELDEGKSNTLSILKEGSKFERCILPNRRIAYQSQTQMEMKDRKYSKSTNLSFPPNFCPNRTNNRDPSQAP